MLTHGEQKEEHLIIKIHQTTILYSIQFFTKIQLTSLIIYFTSRTKLAISTATFKALSLAENESNILGWVSLFSRKTGEKVWQAVFRWVFSRLDLSSSSPQPQVCLTSVWELMSMTQLWAYVRSIRQSCPSCSKERATASKELRNDSTAIRNSEWEIPRAAAVVASMDWFCEVNDKN